MDPGIIFICNAPHFFQLVQVEFRWPCPHHICLSGEGGVGRGKQAEGRYKGPDSVITAMVQFAYDSLHTFNYLFVADFHEHTLSVYDPAEFMGPRRLAWSRADHFP